MYRFIATRIKRCNKSLFIFVTGLALGFIVGLSFNDQYAKQLQLFRQSIIMKLKSDVSLKEATKIYNNNLIHLNKEHLEKKTVKVLCWVMTRPQHHETRCKHVKSTWGKRCDRLLFMSTKDDQDLPAIDLKVAEGKFFLWYKTRAAFQYVYENYFDQYDWFLKADDDTYVIMENLKNFLVSKNTSEPIYFGCKIWFRNILLSFPHLSGGAGYVLSKEALRRFVTSKNLGCSAFPGPEDSILGKCLKSLSVVIGDSRDSSGTDRFFPLSPGEHLLPPNNTYNYNWYKNFVYYPPKPGFNCCSETAISFHYIEPDMMYVFEYLLYHLRPVGIESTTMETTSNNKVFR